MQRAKGFTLFIAVCNSPATARKLIDLLQESLPGVTIEIVDLGEGSLDPLREVTMQLTSGAGPVMILGLERSVPASQASHQVLRTLNLQRPEWRKRIRRPVVLWIPDYLLTLLGVEAPDFLDWRSDTIFFSSGDSELLPLVSTVWNGGLDGRLSEHQRRARIEEIRSRLQICAPSDDPTVLIARANWLNELGNHLYVLGELHEAEASFLEAQRISEKVRDRSRMSVNFNNRGVIHLVKGELNEAERLFRDALELAAQADDTQSLARASGNLAKIFALRGHLSEAESLMRKALKLADSLQDVSEVLSHKANLALLLMRQRRQGEAELLLQESLELARRSDSLLELAGLYQILSGVYVGRGDLESAEECVRRSSALNAHVSHPEGAARALSLLSLLAEMRGDLPAAREALLRARTLYEGLGNASEVRRIEDHLRSL